MKIFYTVTWTQDISCGVGRDYESEIKCFKKNFFIRYKAIEFARKKSQQNRCENVYVEKNWVSETIKYYR